MSGQDSDLTECGPGKSRQTPRGIALRQEQRFYNATGSSLTGHIMSFTLEYCDQCGNKMSVDKGR